MRYAVVTLGPFDVGLGRLGLAALGSLAFLALPAGPGRPPLRDSCRRHAGGLLLLSALVGYGQTFTMTYGLALTPATVGALIPPLNPVATMLLAAWLLHEPITRRQWVGLGLSVAGVLLLAVRDGVPTWSSLAGPALMALAPLSWAVYTVLSKPLLADIAPLHLTTLTLGGGFLAILPLGSLDLARRLLQARPAEQLALLFHDAVYVPGAGRGDAGFQTKFQHDDAHDFTGHRPFIQQFIPPLLHGGDNGGIISGKRRGLEIYFNSRAARRDSSGLGCPGGERRLLRARKAQRSSRWALLFERCGVRRRHCLHGNN
jgi:hypothetical protein